TLPAAGLLVWLGSHGQAASLRAGQATQGLLVLGGLVTTVPLLLFAGAARRLSMTTLGFLQYLAPSLQFLLAVVAFSEPLSLVQLASFACIWIAVILYTLDAYRAYRRRGATGTAPLVMDPD